MTFRTATLAVFLSFSLSACSGLDALLNEAAAWLEEARDANVFQPLDDSTLATFQPEDDSGEEAYEDLDEIFIDENNKDTFKDAVKNSMKVVLFEVDPGLVPGKIEVADQRLYLEFKPNNAFMAIQPTQTPGEFEADVDFSDTNDDLLITVDSTTRLATITHSASGNDARLVLADDMPRRVVGVDVNADNEIDWYLYSDNHRNGGRGPGRP